MSLFGNDLTPAQPPDGPPLMTMARSGTELVVTCLHAKAADLLWQQRQRLVEIHGCSSLRLILLTAAKDEVAGMSSGWRPTRSEHWWRR
jgi:hypothetical protein